MTTRPYRTAFVGVLLFASACATTGPRATAAPDGARGVRDLLAAYQKHDVEALLAAVTDDVVVSAANQPDRVGKDALRTSAQSAMKELDGVTLTPVRWIVAGDRVLVEWVAARERTSAKPVAYRVNGATLVQLSADGKASRVRHAVDALSMAQQSGVVDVGARTAPLQVEGGAVTAGATSAESQNLDAVRAAFASAEGIATLVSPEAVIEDLSAGQTAHGRAAVEAAVARIKSAFPDATMAAESSFAAGPFVVVDRVVSGRNTGPLGPLPATGRPVRYHALDVYELSNGVIVRAWVYADRSEVPVQLGLGSAQSIPALGFGAK